MDKLKRIPKTVKEYSEQLNIDELETIETILYLRQQCRNYFYSRYSGIEYIDKLDFRKLRDCLLKNEKELIKSFKLPARTWKMELSEIVGNIKSMWSNTFNKVKVYIRDNDNLTDEDRHYLFYILKSTKLLTEVLQKQQLTETDGLKEIQITKDKQYLINLLCRYIRKVKPKISHSNHLRSMQMDTQMYSFENGVLTIQTNENRKRLKVKMKSNNSFNKGNIRIVLNRDKGILELHKCLMIKSKRNNNQTQVCGLDKGYSTMISSSEGFEYGEELGKLLSKTSEYINSKNKQRNPYYAEVRNLKKKLEDKNISKKYEKQIFKKIENIENNNLSNKTYLKQRNKDKEHIKSLVNHEIKEFFKNEKPTTIVLEDLTFVTDKVNKSKNFNRKMSQWVKGYIDERLNYYAEFYNVRVVYVSAAYTSQFCADCGSQLTKRSGTHNEIGHCPNCGKINANINAGKNIKNRMNDPDIKLYTPYKNIKNILLERYENKNN